MCSRVIKHQHQQPHLLHRLAWLIRCIARILHNLILRQIYCKIATVMEAAQIFRVRRETKAGIIKRQIKAPIPFEIEHVWNLTVIRPHTKKEK